MKPPARIARLVAIGLSVVAMGLSIGFGIHLRRVAPVFDAEHPERWARPATVMLVFLLFAMLFRMGASICELAWLERTWSNLPAELRKVGPIDNVTSLLAVGLSLVPGLAWLWKLGLAIAVCDAFEHLRTRTPFAAKIPKRLAIASVLASWVPGLNVYVAPFLWELFALRVDVACDEIRGAVKPAQVPD